MEPINAHSTGSRRKGPYNPYLVLLIAIILPGMGQVLNNTPKRGLTMLLFMLILAWLCFHLTTPQHSVLGRYAGGWFVYAVSIMDAYKWARYRYEHFRMYGVGGPEEGDQP